MASFTARATLAYLAALGRKDPDLRKEHGLSLSVLARDAGVSRSALTRFIRGEGHPTEQTALRLSVLAEDRASEVREAFQLDAADEEIPYVAPPRFPLRVKRYDRPQSTTGKDERSEIIEVDTEGLSNAQIFSILKGWWTYLKRKGGRWDVRFLALVSVRDYFGADGPDSKELRKRVRGERFVPIWLPQRPIIFADSNKRVQAGRYRTPEQAIETINDVMSYRYRKELVTDELVEYFYRIPRDYGIIRLAFIPYLNKPTRRRRRQWKG